MTGTPGWRNCSAEPEVEVMSTANVGAATTSLVEASLHADTVVVGSRGPRALPASCWAQRRWRWLRTPPARSSSSSATTRCRRQRWRGSSSASTGSPRSSDAVAYAFAFASIHDPDLTVLPTPSTPLSTPRRSRTSWSSGVAGAAASAAHSWARSATVSFTTRTAPLPSSTRAPGHSPAATGRVIGSVCPAVDAPTDRGCTDKDLRPCLDASIPRTLSTGALRSP